MGVFWVGGPAAAGKSTVSRLFARKHGFLWYSVDAHAFAHEERAAAAGLHVLGSGPGDFDRHPMILDDIRSLPVSVVVEGAFVTPAMAGVAENAVWLMPSAEEQLARLNGRSPGSDHQGEIWGWGLIQSQLEGTDASIISVDGQTIPQTIAALERQFGSLLAAYPAAVTVDERQSLIRAGNDQLTKSGRRIARVFDCECANCFEFVQLTSDEAVAALTQPPPSILFPH